ncbi:Uncharacterized mitochondrial protein AtMg00300 [Striga hermonthica]|uniref:Uncharacterized mitochondrial protein AtMg00300 n=1 Tax=Striga hermonthica TaxID=68872 RepID=A0A9N7N8V8_STRHE|nr:Uncharacterized mitochondrial protein AtMg00300 [Striga hermonthica]
MNVKIADSMINAVVNERNVELWHNRLSHMSEKGLTVLAKKNLLPGVQTGFLKKCAHCLAGKQTRVAFKRVPHPRKMAILDMVHSDVCGPMKTRTLGGVFYFMTFIDDHSTKIWVYMLKSKDLVIDVFKKFYARVEREKSVKLKCIRTDNRGEYYDPVDEYCRQHGHDTRKIAQLKREFRSGKKILGMKISSDRKNKMLWLSQEDYIKKVLEKFNLSKARVVSSSLAGEAVSWQSKLQKCVALSTTEAEYIAITEGCKKALWMRRFLEELGLHHEMYVVFSDSQSAIHLSKNSSFHSSENGADMMTKTFPKEKLDVCRRRAGLLEPTT